MDSKTVYLKIIVSYKVKVLVSALFFVHCCILIGIISGHILCLSAVIVKLKGGGKMANVCAFFFFLFEDAFYFSSILIRMKPVAESPPCLFSPPSESIN